MREVGGGAEMWVVRDVAPVTTPGVDMSSVVFVCVLLVVVVGCLQQRGKTLMAIIVLLPLTPLFAVRMTAVFVVWLCDKFVEGWWAAPFRWAARHLEETIWS